MGCNKICKAKKKAKAAEDSAKRAQASANAQVAAAQKKADAAAAQGKGYSNTLTVTSYSVETVTVAKYLGIDKKKNALSIREMQVLLQTAGRSPEISAQTVAKNLIKPLTTAMGAYQVLDALRTGWLIVKPVVKIAQQINDAATCNFAAIGEMIADIGQMILQVLIGFAPMLIELLKNLFLDIPLYTKVITKEQSIRIQNLINLSTINVRQRITDSLESISVDSLSCPSVTDALALIKEVEQTINVTIETYVQNTTPLPTLESLTDVDYLREVIIEYIVAGLKCARKTLLQKAIKEVDKEEINILEIPDIANADPIDKQTMKSMMEGLLTVTKKVELAKAEELLRRNFESSQQTPTEEGEVFADQALAEAAADMIIQALRDMLIFAIKAFNKTGGATRPVLDLGSASKAVLDSEVKKKIANVEEAREDIVTLTIVEELMQSNKIQILRNVISALKGISFDPADYSLDDCISANINTDFDNMKSTIIADNITTIDATVITDTTQMIALRDTIYTETNLAINSESIILNDTGGFAEQVCESVERFKSELVLTVEKNINSTSINIVNANIPDYINPLKLKKMVKIFNTEINRELILAARTIVLEDLLPCKSCKPCEQIRIELNNYALNAIEKIKDEMIRNSGVFIKDESLDWTITDAQSIIDAKLQLVNISTEAVNTNAGAVNLYDTFIYRLKLEETELLKSINAIIKNL